MNIIFLHVNRITLLCFCLLAALVLSTRDAEALDLVTKRTSGYVIVGDNKDPAVLDLQYYLWRMTGVDIPVAPLNIDPLPEQAIILGMRAVPGYVQPTLSPQGFHLKVVGKRLVVRGGSPLGLQHGIYGLLDAMGCRWLTPDFEQIPMLPGITIPDALDLTQEPSIRDRGHIGGDFGDDTDTGKAWRRRNRVSATLEGGALPNLYTILPPTTYFTEHPDWYPMDARGKRINNDPNMGLCWSNGAMIDELVRLTKVEMVKSPASRFISVSQGDGLTPCLCPECRALVKRYGSESAPLINGLNRVLADTKKSYKTHCLVTLVAGKNSRAPINKETNERLVPDANLYIEWMRQGDALHTISSDANTAIRDEFLEWTTLTKNLRVWSRSIALRGPAMPFPNYRAMSEDITWFSPHVKGFRFQGSNYGGVDFGQMRAWLAARLMWNANADVQKLEQEFLRGYYGEAAAKPLWTYLQGAQKRAAESPTAIEATAPLDTIKTALYPPEQLGKDMGYFTQAIAAADASKNADYANHARQTMATSLVLAQYVPPAPLQPVVVEKKNWLLPRGSAQLAAISDFAAEAFKRYEYLYDGAPWYGRVSFLRRAGGRVEPEIENDFIRVGFCANLGGMICSIYDKVTKRELLALGPAEEPSQGGICDTIGMSVHNSVLSAVTRKNTLFVNSQATVTTNPWVETPCVQQRRQVELPAGRRGFSVTTWLFATPDLPAYEKTYSDPAYGLSSTVPLYAAQTLMRWKITDPARARVLVAAKDMVREHAFSTDAVFRVPMPTNRVKDATIRCFLLTTEKDPVITLDIAWADFESLHFTMDAARKEIVVTSQAIKKKAVVNDHVPMSSYSVDIISMADAERLMPLTKLRAETGDGSVTLSWRPKTAPETVEYRVYSNTAPTGKFTQVAVVPAKEHSVTLTKLANGRRLYYRVTTVDKDFGEGMPSSLCNPIPSATPHTSFLVANDGQGDFLTLQEAFNALPTVPWTRDITLQVRDTSKLLPEGYPGGIIPESVITAAKGRRLNLISVGGTALITSGIDLNGGKTPADGDAGRVTANVTGFLFSKQGAREGCALECPGINSHITENEFRNWGTAIALQNTMDNAATTIDRNYFVDCDSAIADGGSGNGGTQAKPLIVRNCVFEKLDRGVNIANPTNTFVINNTFLHIDGYALRLVPDTSLTIANNLFADVRRAAYALTSWTKTEMTAKPLSLDYNLFFQSVIAEYADGKEPRLEDFQAGLRQELHSITGDPLLVIPEQADDPSLDHINLERDSSARDTGKEGLPYGDKDYFGNPRVQRGQVDIGAVEMP